MYEMDKIMRCDGHDDITTNGHQIRICHKKYISHSVTIMCFRSVLTELWIFRRSSRMFQKLHNSKTQNSGTLTQSKPRQSLHSNFHFLLSQFKLPLTYQRQDFPFWLITFGFGSIVEDFGSDWPIHWTTSGLLHWTTSGQLWTVFQDLSQVTLFRSLSGFHFVFGSSHSFVSSSL